MVKRLNATFREWNSIPRRKLHFYAELGIVSKNSFTRNSNLKTSSSEKPGSTRDLYMMS